MSSVGGPVAKIRAQQVPNTVTAEVARERLNEVLGHGFKEVLFVPQPHEHERWGKAISIPFQGSHWESDGLGGGINVDRFEGTFGIRDDKIYGWFGTPPGEMIACGSEWCVSLGNPGPSKKEVRTTGGLFPRSKLPPIQPIYDPRPPERYGYFLYPSGGLHRTSYENWLAGRPSEEGIKWINGIPVSDFRRLEEWEFPK